MQNDKTFFNLEFIHLNIHKIFFYYVVDYQHRAIDDGKFFVAGFLDLAKAFDRFNHDNYLVD